MRYYRIIYIVLNFIIFGFVSPLSAQQDTLILSEKLDTIAPDSLAMLDSLSLDSQLVEKDNISDDALDTEVSYGARDTQWYDHVYKKMHLFGDAYVNYGAMELKAGYIIYDIGSSMAEAYSIQDTSGQEVQKPTFKDGDQTFTYEQLKYNFKSKKGLVTQAITEEGDLFVIGATTKFIGKMDTVGREDDVIFNTNALITSCDHDHPHYGIRTKRLKVIPKKVGVTGPARLELGGVPTPIWLPFGFFPLADGRSTGLIFPSDFPYEEDRGFGVRGLGWYFPINDYIDLKVTGDIFTRGSWLANAGLNYKKRYKYNGGLTLSYADTKTENFSDGSIESNPSFNVRLKHTQSAKAHPYRSIGGEINFSSNGFNARNNIDATNVLTNRYTSNFRFKHKMPRTPFNFSLGLRHDQNTQTKVVNVTLPELDLNMNTIYPFRRKNKGSNQEKWYEIISLKYDSKAANYISTVDTALFTQDVFDNMKYGIRQKASTGASFPVLKYITINPSASFEEHWVFRSIEKQYFEAEDSIASNTVDGFLPFRKFNTGIRANTQLFGTMLFKKGPIRGIRHTVKPSISFNYNPDTQMKYEEVLLNSRDEEVDTYSRFEGGPFGSPRGDAKTAGLNYGLGNVLEIKHFKRKDSTEQKIRVLESLNFSGSYNFAADSLNWSPISVRSNTRIFKRLTKLTLSATLDPYAELGNTRMDVFTQNELGKIVRVDRWSADISTDFTVKQMLDLFKSEKDGDAGRDESDDSFKPTDTKLMDLLGSLRVNHRLGYSMSTMNNTEMDIQRTHTLAVSGNLNITDNWNVNIGNLRYDFLSQSFVYPFFTFSRKLHCWKMNFSWAPNGNSYSFFIGVNTSTLDFLKYNHGQNNIGNGGFR